MIRLMRFVLLMALCLVPAVPVSAQPMDFRRVSCSGTAEALEKADATQQVAIISWLLGYASCTNGNTTLDAPNIEQRVKDIFAFCARHPELNVLEAIDNTWR